MSAGAGAGAAAAAAQRLQEEQEEEEMSQYHGDDLGDWEFKILRSTTNAFRKPDRMREILAEEARAGWVLVEKFDNVRVRLKRPTSARANDARLEFDPYRTWVGPSQGKILLFVIGAALALIGFGGIVALLLGVR